MSKRPVAVFDIDGTIFRSSLLIELTRQLVADGVFKADIYQEFDAEYRAWRNRTDSYERYIGGVVAAFAQRLAGKEVAAVRRSAQRMIKNTQLHTYRFTRDLLGDLAKTHFLITLSHSPQEVVKIFAKSYGFSAYAGTNYTIAAGKFGPAQSGPADKAKQLKEVLAANSLGLKGSIGVGDTESDIAFLELVEKPVAFNPNQKLLDTATTRNWDILVERKDVVYHLNCSDNDGCRLY